MSTKKCNKCGEVKTFSEYYKDTGCYGGVRPTCRRCDKKYRDSLSPTHKLWLGMRKRCYSPSAANYHLYGGRGIRICEEWGDRLVFERWCLENGYNDGLQIDRIDCDGNYEPSNCRFVSPEINVQNRRCTKLTLGKAKEILQRRIIDGEKLDAIAEEYRISFQTVCDISKGRSWKNAMSEFLLESTAY